MLLVLIMLTRVVVTWIQVTLVNQSTLDDPRQAVEELLAAVDTGFHSSKSEKQGLTGDINLPLEKLELPEGWDDTPLKRREVCKVGWLL